MEPYYEKVTREFDEWKNREPGTIEKVSGFVGKPMEVVLQPFVEKVGPLLEDALKHTNRYIAEAIQSNQEEIIDITKFTPDEFVNWHQKADEYSGKLHKAGIAALSTSGAVGGFLGFGTILAEVPISFGTILAFANKIAATYNIDITQEESQVEILKAITVGSSDDNGMKQESVSGLSVSNVIIRKASWTSFARGSAYTAGSLAHITTKFLKLLGLGISRRKAAQFIPGLGAVTGGVINGAWADESLGAVREYCRYSVTKRYFESFPVETT